MYKNLKDLSSVPNVILNKNLMSKTQGIYKVSCSHMLNKEADKNLSFYYRAFICFFMGTSETKFSMSVGYVHFQFGSDVRISKYKYCVNVTLKSALHRVGITKVRFVLTLSLMVYTWS